MLINSGDAWAVVLAVAIISVSMVTHILRKVQSKRTKFSWLWLGTEISTAIFTALLAWEMHPYIDMVSDKVPRDVFTAVAIHCAARFMQKIETMIMPK